MSEVDFEQMAEQADSEPAETLASEPPEEAVERPGKDHPGYAPVDLSDLPEEKRTAIEARFGYFFKQDKARERELKELRQIAQEQYQRLEEVTNGVGEVVDHLHTQTTTAKEAQLEREMREAFETGDNERYLKAQKDLIKLEAEKLIKPQAKQQVQQPQKTNYPPAQEFASDLDPQEQMLVSTWAEERDSSGGKLRPWTEVGNPNTPNPDYVRAVVIANNLAQEKPHLTTAQFLSELDRQMGTKPRQVSQSVMGGSLNTVNKGGKLTLSDQQKDLAMRLKVGGKNASPEQHLAAYKAQLEKTRARGGR